MTRPIARNTTYVSIKTRFIALILLLLLFTMAMVATVRAQQLSYQTRTMISGRLQHNANVAAGIFYAVRVYTEWMLGAIANLPHVQEALTGDAHDRNADLEKTLAAFLSSMNRAEGSVPSFANILVFDVGFRPVAMAHPEGDTVKLSYGAFSQNIVMAAMGQPFVSPIVKNPQSGLWQFLFTHPVLIGNSFSGMVAILGNTEVLDYFLRGPAHHFDSFVNIADRAGTIFSSSRSAYRSAYIGHNLDDLGIRQVIGYIPLNRMFNHSSAITGIDKIAYITTKPLLGWTILSFFYADAVESIAWAILVSLFPTVFGVALTAIFLIVIVHRSLTPFNALASTAKDVANGNLEVTFDTSRNDEISQVSQSFLDIVTALNILQDNFRKAERAMTSKDTIYMLEDSRLGGVYDEMLARTNNVIKHIQRSRLEAENASKAKSNFLSKMSHEIRTPMNAIMGMAELVLREDISLTAREQVLAIKQSGDHLLSIINDILDLSKVESGKLEIINAEYLFHSTIHDVIRIIKMRMTNPELNFAVYMQHDIPNELLGDEVRIRQVLLNILTNALKYTRKGYFSLDITSQWTSEGAIMLTIKIKDTGIGIKPENIEKIFGEFTQFDVGKNRSIEGTGLGLAITKSLINLMGGSIKAFSKYGEGSEFIVRLPQRLSGKNYRYDYGASAARFEGKNVLLYGRTPVYTEYAARALEDLGVDYHIVHDDSELHNKLLEKKWGYVFAEENLAVTALHIVYTRELDTKVVLMSDSYVAKGGQDFAILIMPAYYLSIVNVLSGEDSSYFAKSQQMEHFIAPKAKVLLVDDIATNLKVGEGLLKTYDLNITTCFSGREAIEAVVSDDYDLVFMDHMMPEMDGVEVVRRIRAFAGEKYANLPIIALTANAIVGAKEFFLQNSFNDFLSKPIETVKLNSILVKWIPKEKQQRIDPALANMPEGGTYVQIKIEDIDTAKGIVFSGGSVQNYLGTLKVFHEEGLTKVDEILSSLESNNLPLYTVYVHALKSASANIGAIKLSEEAKILEAAGMKQDLDFIKKHNDGLVDNLKKLLAHIGEAISANAEKPGDKTLGVDVMKLELVKLKTALANFDVVAIDNASLKLQYFTQFPDLGGILQNAFVGKYKQAAAQIEEFMGKL